MPRLKANLAFVCFLASLSPTTYAAAAKSPPETVAQIIVRQEKAFSQTYVTGDSAAATKLVAKDFTGLDQHGKPYDRASMLKDISQPPHQISAHVDSIKVEVHGDVAIAIGTETDTGPKTSDIEHRIWLDTWTHTTRGWELLASSEMTPDR